MFVKEFFHNTFCNVISSAVSKITKINLSVTIPRRKNTANGFKEGFTLAETLLTLVVIGIIAILTIPSFIADIKKAKFGPGDKKMVSMIHNGFGQMIADEDITGYNSTEEFTAEMSKYFRISSVCTAENLSNCFTDKFVAGTKTIELSKIKTAKNLGKTWTVDTNVNGILFADGTNALIAYNTACTSDDTKSNTEIINNCVALIYDLDGPTKTNVYTENGQSDIGLYNASITPEADCGELVEVNRIDDDHKIEVEYMYNGKDKDSEECKAKLKSIDAYSYCMRNSDFLPYSWHNENNKIICFHGKSG